MTSARGSVCCKAKLSAPALNPGHLGRWKKRKLAGRLAMYASTGFQSASSLVLLSTTMTSKLLYSSFARLSIVAMTICGGSL